MNLKDIHDQVKANYENGEYDKQINADYHYNFHYVSNNPDKISWYYQIRRQLFSVLIILFVATAYSLVRRLIWLRYISIALFLLNIAALLFICFKIKKCKNDTQMK